ncbi:hypothetical protein C8J57DRAFT_1250423 [Mycena rebaudengoi]|nr:hypothetical protein C8J57DRAFT_1250423 [Mycena rebaudengoi]
MSWWLDVPMEALKKSVLVLLLGLFAPFPDPVSMRPVLASGPHARPRSAIPMGGGVRVSGPSVVDSDMFLAAIPPDHPSNPVSPSARGLGRHGWESNDKVLVVVVSLMSSLLAACLGAISSNGTIGTNHFIPLLFCGSRPSLQA